MNELINALGPRSSARAGDCPLPCETAKGAGLASPHAYAEAYAMRQKSAAEAVAGIADGETLVVGMAVGQPSALLDAVAEREGCGAVGGRGEGHMGAGVRKQSFFCSSRRTSPTRSSLRWMRTETRATGWRRSFFSRSTAHPRSRECSASIFGELRASPSHAREADRPKGAGRRSPAANLKIANRLLATVV